MAPTATKAPSFLDGLRAKLTEALTERSGVQTALDDMLAVVQTEQRSELTADEATVFAEKRDALAAIDEKVTDLRSQVDELEAIEKRATDAAALAATIEPAAPETRVRVGAEPLTYRAGPGAPNFLQDAYNAQFNSDSNAAGRIARHQAEMDVELRAVGTSAFTTGLVVPQYLTEMFAPLARAGRPFLDQMGSLDLPAEGMTLNVPRLTTGTADAAQATENSGVNLQDPAATLLTVNVNTYAGQAVLSRQSVERGTGIESIVIGDLIADYHTKLDAAGLNGAGTGGTHLGILNVAGINSVTLSTATTVALFPKLADAIQRINTNRFVPANLIVMHPRRWGSLLASLDSSNRPLVVPYGGAYSGQNVMGEGASGAPFSNVGAGIVGSILGVPVLVDANVPTNLGAGTNEDRIIVMATQDTKLWEQPSSPLALRFEQTAGANLSVTVVVYGYSAFTAGRYPTGISVISGTGLVTPTF